MKLGQSDAAVSIGQHYILQKNRKSILYDTPQAAGHRIFDSQREPFFFEYRLHHLAESHIVVDHEDRNGLRAALLVSGRTRSSATCLIECNG
jgi:hypothetical protein